MRNILIILLFTGGLVLISCTKSNPQPTSVPCEQGGEEVAP